MPSPQFRKRAPGRSDPVTREELQRKAEAWAILCSQLDDYAIAGNQRGVRRVLNRLHYSVRQVRARHAIDNPGTAQRADAYDAAQPITQEDYDGAQE